MKQNPKKCKGTTSTTNGYGCGDLTIFRKYGLCKSKCYPNWLLNTPAGKNKMNSAITTVSAPRKDLERESKSTKDRKKLGSVLSSLTNLTNKYVRMRDVGKSCISCGIPYKSDFDAGHFYKAELYTSLKFDVDNIHGQCIKCNRMLEGNLNPYSINLPNRIGDVRYKALILRAEQDKKQSNKWDRLKLQTIRKQINKLTKEL